MSTLFRLPLRRAAQPLLRAPTQLASFHASSRIYANENAPRGHRNSEAKANTITGQPEDEKRAADIEQAKNEQFKQGKNQQGINREELSSGSEDAVKADRNETNVDAKQDTEQLQRETEDLPSKKHGQ